MRFRWARGCAGLLLAASVTVGCGSETGRISQPEATAPHSSSLPPAEPAPSTTETGDPVPAPQSGEEAAVLSVTDGDTLRVLVEGANEPLRLIGINAPEEGECLAAEATARLAELVGEGSVRLEPDVSDRDDFGRLLRYVHSDDLFVNQALVREGLALARRYEPDVARADQLEAAQAAAASDGVGMWNSDACGSVEQADLEIGQIRYDAAGDDNTNLNDEWVELRNTGEGPLDLSGWAVKDESASHRYTFPSGFHLAAGASVRIRTGCGTDSGDVLYWCSEGSAVWNNSGDTVFVLDPSGNIVVSRSYRDRGDGLDMGRVG